MYKIMVHEENKNGWSVSLVKYTNGELTNGFTLNSFETKREQELYCNELYSMTEFEIEYDF